MVSICLKWRKTEPSAVSASLAAHGAQAPSCGDTVLSRVRRRCYRVKLHMRKLLIMSFSPFISIDNVEPELLHTYSRIDPYDTLILCVRVAVLTAVTLTVPIVLFPVSLWLVPPPFAKYLMVVLSVLSLNPPPSVSFCRYAEPSSRCCSPPSLSTGCVTLPSLSFFSPSSTCWWYSLPTFWASLASLVSTAPWQTAQNTSSRRYT